MRRPDFHAAVLALEFGAAVADQRFQRIRGGGDAERLHLVARRPRQRGGVFLLGGEAELLCQFGIERRNGGRGAVIGGREFALRSFAEAAVLCSPSSPLPPRSGGEGSGVGGASANSLSAELAGTPPTPDPSPPRASRVGGGRRASRFVTASRFATSSLVPRVDARARCAAASPPARRSQELSGGGCRPVPEPRPLSPRLIAGLSSSASAGPIGCTSGRRLGIWRFGFRGFAGLFGRVGILRHQANMG